MQLDQGPHQLESAPLSVTFHAAVIAGIGQDLRKQADRVAQGWLFGYYSEATRTVLHFERYQALSDEVPGAPDLLGTVQASSRTDLPPIPAPEFDGIFVRISPDSRSALVADVFLRGTPLCETVPFCAPGRARVVADFDASPPVPPFPGEMPARPPAAESDAPVRAPIRRTVLFPGAIALVGSLLGLAGLFQTGRSNLLRPAAEQPALFPPGQPHRPLPDSKPTLQAERNGRRETGDLSPPLKVAGQFRATIQFISLSTDRL